MDLPGTRSDHIRAMFGQLSGDFNSIVNASKSIIHIWDASQERGTPLDSSVLQPFVEVKYFETRILS